MARLVPIGQFAQLTRLTIRALRFYDEIGLLVPARVDPESGYRYYRLEQIAVAERIRLLRELEMPVEEIRLFLREPSEGIRLLEAHKARLRLRFDDLKTKIERLETVLEEKPMSYKIRVKEVPAQPIVYVREHVVLPEIGGVIKSAMDEAYRFVREHGLELAGDCFCSYPIPHEGEQVPVDAAIPVKTARRGGRVQAGELPAGLVAYAVHVGPYDQLPGAFQAVYAWAAEQGYEVLGPPREIYLEGPPHPKTEVAWPVKRAE